MSIDSSLYSNDELNQLFPKNKRRPKKKSPEDGVNDQTKILEKQLKDLSAKTTPSAYPQINNKYKTILCQNYKFLKHCVRGSKCHFAHGEAECTFSELMMLNRLFPG